MREIHPLPKYLVQRYETWRDKTYAENAVWYRHLAEEGQHPRAMIISCCDSRVNVVSIFGAEQGEFFIHRNIANLVPPYNPDGTYHGTSAAVEYAVSFLKVAHIIVLGHSHCGGVQGCVDLCRGEAPELAKETSFLGQWMNILKPGYDRLQSGLDRLEAAQALEREAILISLENLHSFPFVAEAQEKGHLSLHGLWHDIGDGTVEHYVPGKGFEPI